MPQETTGTSCRGRVGPYRGLLALRIPRTLLAALVVILGAVGVATASPIGAASARTFALGTISTSPVGLSSVGLSPVADEAPVGARLRLPLPLIETPGPVGSQSAASADTRATSATVRIEVEISDQTAPTISMKSGPVGEKGKRLKLTAHASDDVGVVGVAFYRGDTRLGLASERRGGEWTADLGAAEVAHLTARGKGSMPGPVYALAVDAAGNVGRSGHVRFSVDD